MARLSFDLNGTLLDPGDQADVLQRAVGLAMAYTIVGEFRPFAELLEAAGGRTPDHMPAFSDVEVGLSRLRGAGHELVVITNSSTTAGEHHLEQVGLRDWFAEVVGTDLAGAYKPDSRVYDLARADWHITAHAWDILGAGAAGRRTIYVQRERPLPAAIPADIVVRRLDELHPALTGG